MPAPRFKNFGLTMAKLNGDLIMVIFLFLSFLKFAYGIPSVMNLKLYDESFYLYNGVNLMRQGLPNAQWSPLYALWYFFLSLLVKDPIDLYYANFLVSRLMLVVLFYVYLRRLGTALPAAGIGAYLLLVSSITYIWPWPFHFCLVLLLIFLLMSTFMRHKPAARIFLTGGFLLLSYARPEYFLSFLIFLGGCLGMLWRRGHRALPKDRRTIKAFVVLVLLSSSLLVWWGLPMKSRAWPALEEHLSWPQDLDRTWGAFIQNFSNNYVKWHGLSLNPWTSHEEIARFVFPGARTIAQAASANPPMFQRHLLTNLKNYLLLVPQIGTVDLKLFLSAAVAQTVRWAQLSLLGILFLWALARCRGSGALRGEGFKDLVFVFAAAFLPTFLASLLMAPRPHYLIVQNVLGAAIMIYVISQAFGRPGEQPKARIYVPIMAGAVIYLLTPNVAGAGWRLFFNDRPAYQSRHPVIRTIELIRSLDLRGSVNILEADGGYHFYLGGNFRRVGEHLKKEPFDRFVVAHDVGLIVVSGRLMEDHRFAADPSFKSFLRDPEALGFVRVPAPALPVLVFVNRNLTSIGDSPRSLGN
jgi:hypothetical protein